VKITKKEFFKKGVFMSLKYNSISNMHICTSNCRRNGCPICEHGYNENDESRQCPTCSMSKRERTLGEMDIFKSWYNKRWISYNEYLRLMDLIF